MVIDLINFNCFSRGFKEYECGKFIQLQKILYLILYNIVVTSITKSCFFYNLFINNISTPKSFVKNIQYSLVFNQNNAKRDPYSVVENTI